MKVFISHSSRDKWIARKLSEEIVDLGCETFLDEKDIETGESIDEVIHDQLSDCDDFLLLLSPDSKKSDWVLFELGGARALKKRIVVILLYLGANDIPKPISLSLARDINDVEKYYDEVKKKLSGKKIPALKKRATVLKKAKPKRRFKVGDRVRLVSTPQSATRHVIGWNDEMDGYCGTIATVNAIYSSEDISDNSAYIEEDGGEWSWAFEWLTHVEE